MPGLVRWSLSGVLLCLFGWGLVSLAVPPQSACAADDLQSGFFTPEKAASDPDFALQGEYTGENLGVQVVAQGAGKFLVVTYRGGLPGAGWNGTQKQDSDEDAAGVRKEIADLKLKKVERRSPTLGLKPPAKAVVLFDGTEATFKKHWKEGARTSQGLLEQGATSVETFQDFTIHLEFRLPYMPAARGQGRGNSGLYYQGRYETQMLDSFGLEGKDNECGGLYSIRQPDLNMCLPPLAWQTYDADFTAARYDDAGKKLANARITVKLNGVVVHEEVELPRNTTAAPNQEGPNPGPIYLQDHGNPIRYRNIWVLPRDLAAEARHPVVPAFERLVGQAGGDPLEPGRHLLNELSCTACHTAGEELARTLIPRPGPVLTQIGLRARPEWLVKFLSDPHGTKPGTAMPDLLRSLPEQSRNQTALALAHFLASTGTPPERGSDVQATDRGRGLYHSLGCVACHAPREGATVPAATAVPLGNLTAKYTIPSLATFLENPHQARPSGRMPRLTNNPQEASDLAHYLIGPVEVRPKNPNFKYAVYHGDFPRVPDFSKLKPVKQGESGGFQLEVAGRGNNYAIRFEGFFKVDRAGEYTFHLSSDDGSLLFIDDRKVADSDGVHPPVTNSGKVRLEPGLHPLRVEFAQVGGGAELSLEYEGPGIGRQDANSAIFLTPQGAPPKPPSTEPPAFELNPQLAQQGRELFQSVGCAACHEFETGGKKLASQAQAPALEKCQPGRGCLAANPAPYEAGRAPIPAWDLSDRQSLALAGLWANGAPAAPPQAQSDAAVMDRTLLAYGCVACHARGRFTGPDRAHNPLFKTSIPEMGDEGRLPPPLDGVGDKLNDGWLAQVLKEGAKDRPYMLTRMPRYAVEPVSALAARFIATDRAPESPAVPLPESEIRAKAVGRHLVGDKALGCIKCHTFGPHATPGIRALDLQTMTRRVREDWFHRYMLDPPRFRPGTRMPTGFPDGKATIRDVYEGVPARQLAAIWSYLKDADRAALPEGLGGSVIELRPDERPVIYRNFIEGLSPRGIAVGYPEKANIAWDANRFSLTLLWHGRFIDAAKHWEGRGPGFQGPLGDHLIRLEETVPLAFLEAADANWPATPPKEQGWQFKGYRLDREGRPHFLAQHPRLRVDDFPEPFKGQSDTGVRRQLQLEATGPTEGLWFRAAVGQIEPQPDGSFLVNGLYRVKLPGSEPVLRESQGKRELLVQPRFTGNKARLVQEIDW